MPGYALYRLDDHGGFSKSHDIPARNDREAVSLARTLKINVKCELRDEGRLVATLEPAESGGK
jgi:hypothetical protein